jgi:hypothetical protein
LKQPTAALSPLGLKAATVKSLLLLLLLLAAPLL